MHQRLFDKLICPECAFHPLTLDITEKVRNKTIQGKISCPNCSATFSIINGIPVLLPASFQLETLHSHGRSNSKQKIDQIVHFNQIGSTELEICRPHGLGSIYNYLIEKKIQTVLALWGEPLNNKLVIDICCGSGMDLEYLYQAGANPVGVDISLGALLGAQVRAKRYGLNYDLMVADSENLPLVDGSFEVAFVHDGLHHLEHPEKGFLEMARVASEGVLITEPARSIATRIAIQLGMAESVEESGNPVHRFSPEEFQHYAAIAGLGSLAQKRYFMYYQQEPLPIFKWFESQPAFSFFTTAYEAVNHLIAPWGNKIALAARR